MSVARNSVTALIGPSGCGKSTLLRTLNRMYALYPGQKASGPIMLDGEDILRPGVNLAMLRAKVGMVFQKPTPFPMSIYDNVAFGVRLYETCPNPRWPGGSRSRCAAPPCGTRSRTSFRRPALVYRAANNSDFVSRAVLP